MVQNLSGAVAVIGIDIGKNAFHVVGLDSCGQGGDRDNSDRLRNRRGPRPGWSRR